MRKPERTKLPFGAGKYRPRAMYLEVTPQIHVFYGLDAMYSRATQVSSARQRGGERGRVITKLRSVLWQFMRRLPMARTYAQPFRS